MRPRRGVPPRRIAARRSLAKRPVPQHIGRARLPAFGTDLPSLIRFIVTLAVLAGLVYAGMFALATFVEPDTREMKVRIPQSKLQPGG